ncbi:MAG: hypothetical protein M3Y27_06530, partial [Acidobacteriota bacterium]|nr:hypothetical protein [Acidobacteriota bacterium]
MLHGAQDVESTKLKKLPAGQNVLWQDPGAVESLDLMWGVGGEAGQPRPPFQFVEESLSGTTPKVKVKDAQGTEWVVKFGEEAKPSAFATRLVWACGYTAEVEYLIAHGRIEGAQGLKRGAAWLQKDGAFINGRFQLRSDRPRFITDHNWSWVSNPFVGTPELNGLKILVMLLSNWDTKDARDVDRTGQADSNLAIFEDAGPNAPRYLYFISDWGASLGKWGNISTRSKADCKGYATQTPDFVQGSANGLVRWGFMGKRNDDIVKNIRVTDVQWLMQYLGRITDEQLRRGLAASGDTPEE